MKSHSWKANYCTTMNMRYTESLRLRLSSDVNYLQMSYIPAYYFIKPDNLSVNTAFLPKSSRWLICIRYCSEGSNNPEWVFSLRVNCCVSLNDERYSLFHSRTEHWRFGELYLRANWKKTVYMEIKQIHVWRQLMLV